MHFQTTLSSGLMEVASTTQIGSVTDRQRDIVGLSIAASPYYETTLISGTEAFVPATTSPAFAKPQLVTSCHHLC